MFWGIDRDEWVQLWAGLFGAVPAAILSAGVAAWVAVRVLNRSNEHQRELAERVSVEQQAQSERALEEQRAQLGRQLTEQRELSERQLSEQRAEAGRVREQAAIADAVIAAEDFIIAANESPEAVNRQLPVMKSATTRWRVELGIGAMAEELQYWPGLLFSASTVAALEHRTGVLVNGTGAGPVQAETVIMFTTTAFEWASADDDQKAALHARLKDFRLRKREFLSGAEEWLADRLVMKLSLAKDR